MSDRTCKLVGRRRGATSDCALVSALVRWPLIGDGGGLVGITGEVMAVIVIGGGIREYRDLGVGVPRGAVEGETDSRCELDVLGGASTLAARM